MKSESIAARVPEPPLYRLSEDQFEALVQVHEEESEGRTPRLRRPEKGRRSGRHSAR